MALTITIAQVRSTLVDRVPEMVLTDDSLEEIIDQAIAIVTSGITYDSMSVSNQAMTKLAAVYYACYLTVGNRPPEGNKTGGPLSKSGPSSGQMESAGAHFFGVYQECAVKAGILSNSWGGAGVGEDHYNTGTL